MWRGSVVQWKRPEYQLVNQPALAPHKATWLKRRWQKVQVYTLSLLSSLLFCPPPTYFFGVNAYFDLFTLVTKITEFWKFVVGLAVGWNKSRCLSGLRFLIYKMRCWNRWFQHIPSGLMIVWMRVSVPPKPLPLELWHLKIQIGKNALLHIQHVTDLKFSSGAFECVPMARRKTPWCIYKPVTNVTQNT